ncbi:lipopolysaccharide biosynthesis protein [Psychrosphaera aestuarii]|uniref:lipopolysaccharide biosynthesis protein n=1 Tax=Psychrosphaera aestuarii TaxID=1266052 RepID=UPI001B31E2DF|nr:lipopolysaccharide biosynthesis protein [Psychrosphaera aestuarii]
MKKAFFWSFATNYLGIVINFISVIVLARLLTPSQIGTFAIASAIFAIGQIFRDMGVSSYLIRERNLSEAKVSGALAIVWILCTSIALILFTIANPISIFYKLPELSKIFQILAVNILIIPFGTVAQTLLRREMNFKTLGGIELVSQTIHLVVAVSLALHNFGASSLAWASLSATICTLLLLNVLVKKNKRYLPKLGEISTVFPSISTIGFANVLATLNNRSASLIIGKSLSEGAVAIMDKSLVAIEMLNQLLMKAIQNVLLPLFTKVRGQRGDLKKVYLLITDYTLLMALPFLFYIAVLAEFVVLTLFGEQWVEAIPLIPVFALSAAFGLSTRYFSEITISLDLERVLLKLNLIVFVSKVISIIFASPYGLIGIAYVLLAISMFRAFYIMLLLKRFVGIGFLDFLRSIKVTLFVTLISTTPYWLGNFYSVDFQFYNAVVPLFLIVVAVWLSAIYITNHSAKVEVINIYKKLRK